MGTILQISKYSLDDKKVLDTINSFRHHVLKVRTAHQCISSIPSPAVKLVDVGSGTCCDAYIDARNKTADDGRFVTTRRSASSTCAQDTAKG